MKLMQRSILAFLTTFALFGLIACDDAGGVDDGGVGGAGEGAIEEPLAPEGEALD